MITLERSVWPPARGLFKPVDFAHYAKQQIFAAKRGYTTPTKSEWDTFYKFSVVRNPWDRVFSWYRNVIRDPLHRQTFEVADTCSFEEFVDKQLGCWALDQQLTWLREGRGQIALDYVGRFERLDETYAHVCRELDIQEVELPNLLKSQPVDYREYYSDALRQRVAEKYADEIEMFDYVFG